MSSRIYEPWRLESSVVLVTGASSGIGRAASIEFARAGSRVVLVARRGDRLQEAAREAEAAGGEAMAEAADVAVPGEIERAVAAALGRWGRIDVLVNNAGVGLEGRVESLRIEDFRRILEVNLLGAVRSTQAVLPGMKAARRGQIVQISSIVGRRAVPTSGAYAATKFALEAVSEAARVELAPYGIGVTVVRPGLTRTEFAQAALGRRERPIRERGWTAERVARAIVRATRRRAREVNLTFEGRALLVVNRFLPRIADRVLDRMTRPRG